MLLALLIYGTVGSFDLFNFDDDLYVFDNPAVLNGLTFEGLRWAASNGDVGVWIPTTWVSLQIDAALWGPNPGGFHLTNLFLHVLNALLVFLLTRALTGGRWRALTVATIFAVHPLNTEAVAWITARKDLLMGTWGLTALLCWYRADGRWSGIWSAAAAVCALLAMAAKPQAAVLPVLMVLVAQWRRGDARWKWASLKRDLPAVAPFGAASAVVALVAFFSIRRVEYSEVPLVPVVQRLIDAPGFVWMYLGKLVHPGSLAPVYPAEGLHLSDTWGALALLALVAATAMLLRWRRDWPALLFGWIWFLVWLLPTLNLIQGGQLLMGDRYAYVAMVGVTFAVADSLARFVGESRRWRLPLALLLFAAIGLGAFKAREQASYWRDPAVLWRHTLATTENNAKAHQGLAAILSARGRPGEALPHLQAALEIFPTSETLFNAGNALSALGRLEEAEKMYRLALRSRPDFFEAMLNLGSLLGESGRLDEARIILLRAAEQSAHQPAVQFNLGLVAYLAGDRAETAVRLRSTLRLDPGHTKARDLLAELDRAGD